MKIYKKNIDDNSKIEVNNGRLVWKKMNEIVLPSSLMEVTEILQEVFPLPFVGDGVLVEDLGHIREW